MKKREVEVAVISDVHLGTYGCHAKELLMYLKSIKPNKLILNGDIVDIWQFNKKYWPKPHMQIIKHIMGMVAKGTKVHYITGNHDEMMRKFTGFKLGSFSINNKLILNLDGKKAWIFHGDVFDVTMQHSKWLAQLGAIGYDMLILLNRAVNFINTSLGNKPISLSKKIKNSVKSAVKFINDFEKTAADIAIMKGYDYVVCGHIHQPEIKNIDTKEGKVVYLNSGDWVENLTALEYNYGSWSIYNFNDDVFAQSIVLKEDNYAYLNPTQLFNNMQKEFSL
ncbi:MAG: UDP-2,3-diacylglucosamine diphosphatase [Bacteroidota bacterium]|nr:UDP-2,3-diacylglucosamine diphosphatase [Bacteroidota bacterium]